MKLNLAMGVVIRWLDGCVLNWTPWRIRKCVFIIREDQVERSVSLPLVHKIICLAQIHKLRW